MRRPSCGTETGYTLHRRAGETTCDDCRAAHREAEARRSARRGKHPPRLAFVVWCQDFTYEPRDTYAEAQADLEMAEGHGCPYKHIIRRVRLGADGTRWFVDRKTA